MCPIVIGLSVRAPVQLERNGQVYFTVPRCGTLAKLTSNCSSWHNLLMPHGCLCPWPTFHAWVAVVRKKFFSLYYSTYGCYIHQTYTSCSAWHDRMMPHGSLRPWPTFHTWVTMVRIGELCNWIGELCNWIGELCFSIRALSNSFMDKLHLRALIQLESSVIQAEGAIEITHCLSSVEPRELLSLYHCLSIVRP